MDTPELRSAKAHCLTEGLVHPMRTNSRPIPRQLKGAKERRNDTA
ncbi:hypothetical protein ACPOL_0361 [Acidisarcina polymorpha]|uniref:Uncharacterized protein n=1 Tax=Acidisarcina polymorpha TaxID=2211140 RepID=A0A2Z5FSJ7_9BACT|nr:hypothetical protein ACPOL_0361 [Acidisarcina polymorpha]